MQFNHSNRGDQSQDESLAGTASHQMVITCNRFGGDKRVVVTEINEQ